ncbi:MAG: mycofactocin radical SAM maturase [Acidimicrobiales bacterium]
MLADRLATGLDAPICLTWELTYACNLACIHCLSSSGRRDPDELTTADAMRVVDELDDMQVFYVNIGGGEPTIRRDFFDLIEYAVDRRVGVKFSTNGSFIDAAKARRLSDLDYLDIQISLDGADAATNDAVRGEGSYAAARRAMDHLSAAGFGPFKISVTLTRHNVDQLDELEGLARAYGAQLRVTRLRPSGRGAESWHRLHPTAAQQRRLYHWLLDRPDVLTGDSFFHLNALGEPLPGLNLCGAGRVVCLIDPVGDVYACPFVIHDRFKAGSVRDPGGFPAVWRTSELFLSLREPQSAGACASCGSYDACRGGCLAAKFFTGLPLDGPDPECVLGHGEAALAGVGTVPRPSIDHSRPVALLPRR